MFLSNKKYYLGDLFINIYNKQALLIKIKEAILGKKKVTFGYLHAASFYYYQKDRTFRTSIGSFDYIYLNSFYIGKMLKSLYKKEFKKINAEDFFYDLCFLANKKHWKIMLLGSDKETNIKAVKKIKNKYRRIKSFGFQGYFKSDKEAIAYINKKTPNILFVGLGTGYQEKWIYKNIKKIDKPCVIVNIGSFIDVLGEKTYLPPRLIKKLELEWLYRLVKEPKRMFARYVYGGLTAANFFIRQKPVKQKQT